MTRRELLKTGAFAVSFALPLMLGGCGPSHEWRTSNVTGKLPDLEFRLTDERGREVTEADFTGTVNLLFFGFASCPDVCPATLAKLRAVITELDPDAAQEVRVLFVSVDPRRDPPERLDRYTEAFGERFVGLTAPVSRLRDLTQWYGASFSYGEPDESGDYSVQHPGTVYVFDINGKARLLFRESTPLDAMVSDLSALAS